MDSASPQIPRLATLTAREQEVLDWVAEGKTNWEIGCIISCTERTVKKHLQRIFPKLGVENRMAAARAYLQGSSLAAEPTAPGPGVDATTGDAPSL
ncbi:MAG TPA: helix-turn-helix transcriptional regulator [Pyrinomonadaceae bacterium]